MVRKNRLMYLDVMSRRMDTPSWILAHTGVSTAKETQQNMGSKETTYTQRSTAKENPTTRTSTYLRALLMLCRLLESSCLMHAFRVYTFHQHGEICTVKVLLSLGDMGGAHAGTDP